MDKGKVVEFGEPLTLITKDPENDNGITKPDGHLASMILETGDESSRALFISAKRAYQRRRGVKLDQIQVDITD